MFGLFDSLEVGQRDRRVASSTPLLLLLLLLLPEDDELTGAEV